MFRRRYTPAVREALRQAEAIMPPSGELDDLVAAFSAQRGRKLTVWARDLDQTVSGVWIRTEKADYIVVSEHASPERSCAIVCHEIAHALLRHEHDEDLAASLPTSGLLRTDLDPELIASVVAARHAYAHPSEQDAETVGTYLSAELRRRILRGGDDYFDQRWR